MPYSHRECKKMIWKLKNCWFDLDSFDPIRIKYTMARALVDLGDLSGL